jgi:hypothetical protein
MMTEAQRQTAWAPWIRDLAEMLELCLVEAKPRRVETLTPWTPCLWKASPYHVILREQPLAPNLLGEGGKSKELISTPTISKRIAGKAGGSTAGGNRLLPEVGQVADHRAHLLSQWAAPKVRQLCKVEEQTANHHKMLTEGGWLKDHWPCLRERGQGKETNPQ